MAINFDHINEILTNNVNKNLITELNHTYTAAQRNSVTTLTSTSNSTAINMNDSNNYTITMTENTTLADPSNTVVGQYGIIEVIQNATGGFTMSFGFEYSGHNDELPSVSLGPNEITLLEYYVRNVIEIVFISTTIINLPMKSVRFNDDDSAFTSWTPSVAQTNTDIGTISLWFKLGNLALTRHLFNAGASVEIRLDNTDHLQFQSEGSGNLVTTQLFRDPSAWYHIVVAYDTGQGTEANRVKLYLNGTQISTFDTEVYPTQNTDLGYFKDTQLQTVGANELGASEFDGYIAEVIGVDGQQLTPTSFGSFNTQGVWIPKQYDGTFGTNGFHLDFEINTDYGNDVSGNNNNFTDSGLATNDQVADMPTNNYATWSSIDWTNLSTGSISNGNLSLRGTTTSTQAVTKSTIPFPTTGKWYCEVTSVLTGTAGNFYLGVFDTRDELSNRSAKNAGAQLVSVENAGGAILTNTSPTQNISASFDMDSGEVIAIEWDSDIGEFKLTNLTSSETAIFTNFMAEAPQWTLMTFCGLNSTTSKGWDVNFGQQAFAQAIPSGYLTLNTVKLPTPTIKDPSAHFQVHIYTGTGSAHSETFTGNSDLQPDLVWIKNRTVTASDEHKIVDAVRGTTKELNSDSTNVESTDTNGVTAFNTDGFTLGTGAAGYNVNTETFVSWNWKEGTIPGFDIVAYSGDGIAGKTEAHSLGVIPDFMIIKERTNDAGSWYVYHSSNTAAPQTDYLNLDTTAATADLNTIWNDTAPTSSVFSLGDHDDVNAGGDTYIAYLWAEVEGFSKFGLYEGNGNANGTFVWCGFKPAYVMCKSIDSTSTWNIFDNKREGYNVDNDSLFADTSAAEGTADLIDLLSNGFKLRIATDPNVAETYVFAAFAETPFKYARAR